MQVSGVINLEIVGIDNKFEVKTTKPNTVLLVSILVVQVVFGERNSTEIQVRFMLVIKGALRVYQMMIKVCRSVVRPLRKHQEIKPPSLE